MKIDFFGINKTTQNTSSSTTSTSSNGASGQAMSTVQLPIGETTGSVTANGNKTVGQVQNVASTSSTEVAESEAVVKLSGAEEQVAAEFKESAPGTEAEKAETIAFVKRKGLPMDMKVLSAVHQALTQGGSPSAEAVLVLQKLMGESSGDATNLNHLSSLIEGIKHLLENKDLLKAGGSIVLTEQFVLLKKGNQGILLDMAALKALLKDDGQSMEAKLEQLFSDENQVQIDLESDQGETSQIDALFKHLEERVDAQINQITDHFLIVSNTENQVFKQVLRVEVTKEMQAAKVSFNAFRDQLTQKIEAQLDGLKTIDRDSHIGRTNGIGNVENIRDVNSNGQTLIQKTNTTQKDKVAALAQLIQKTDAFILKSDCMLYTSMKNERDLLKVSSALQDALKLLEQGKIADAQNGLREAVKKINAMVFEPSLKRIELQTKHIANRMSQSMHSEQSLKEAAQHKMVQHDMKKMLQQISDQTNLDEPSPRMLLELLRSVGLNHDCEQAALIEQTQQSTKRDERMDQVDQNLKKMLLDMAEEYAKDPKIEPIKQALDTLMGNQLSNRYESGTQEQTMLFMIPLNTTDTEALRVMVNGKKKRDGLDWENCNLYLALESKRFGPLGIKVAIQNKTVSLTVYNDQPENAKVFQTPLDTLMNGLGEIGYHRGRIGFTAFGKKQVAEVEKSVPEQAQSKGGFDFKI